MLILVEVLEEVVQVEDCCWSEQVIHLQYVLLKELMEVAGKVSKFSCCRRRWEEQLL
jgi:hypothetical protein